MLTPGMNPSKMGKKFAATKELEVGGTPTKFTDIADVRNFEKKLKKLEKIIIYLNNHFSGS